MGCSHGEVGVTETPEYAERGVVGVDAIEEEEGSVAVAGATRPAVEEKGDSA